LRVKVGSHEFEAEGSEESVKAQFEAWKELVAASPASSDPADPEQQQDQEQTSGDQRELGRVFSIDSRRKLVSLRILPRGERRDADALLLLLYGYERGLGQEEVLAGRLKQSLAVSGRRIDRIDRAIAPHDRANHVLKGGTGKGGKYSLSNTGREIAVQLMRGLVS
jgi:hypothetical protein